MSVMTALYKKELIEQWRTSKIIILMAAFVVTGLSGPVSLKFLPELLKNSPQTSGLTISVSRQFTSVDYALNFFNGLSLLPVLILILVAMGTIAGERERGTQVLVLTKPVSRSQFVLGKYLAYVTVLAGVVVVTGLAGVYYSVLLSGGSLAYGSFGWLVLAVFSNLSFVLALIILCSSLVKSSVAAGGLSFLLYEVLTISSGFLPSDLADKLPLKFLNQAQPILTGVTDPFSLLFPILIGFLLTGFVLALTCLVAERREI